MAARQAIQTAPNAAGDAGPNWPKTPGGTVDWEAVFEDPETGLLLQFQRVVTPQAMRDSAVTTIKQLFTRKDDEEEAAKLIAELNELIPDTLPTERIELVRYAIIATFRQIKIFRQKKAAEYELQKASETRAAERRAAERSRQSIKKTFAENRRRRRRRMAAVSTIAAIGLGTGLYIYLRPPTYPPRPDQILLQQMKSAAAGGASPTHVYGGVLQTRRWLGDISITAEDVPLDACISVGSNLVKTGIFTVNGEPLQYPSEQAAREICEAAKAPIRITWTPAQ